MKKHIILYIVVLFFSVIITQINCGNHSHITRTSAKVPISYCDTEKFQIKKYTKHLPLERFKNEIIHFAKLDSLQDTTSIDILFTGSSSIRKWNGVDTAFASYKVLNRGFGGSTFAELIYFSDTVIFSHKPKIIVIYEGDNDLYFMSPDAILYYARYLICLIEKKLPHTKIIVLSVKPSPARKNKLTEAQIVNKKLKILAQKDSSVFFIDVWKCMLEPNGRIRKDIFRSDSLHLNAKGYSLWQKRIKPVLDSIMKETP